ncbi:CHAT domain protein [compost metagenome]
MLRICLGLLLLAAFTILLGEARAGRSMNGARTVASFVHQGEWEHATEGAAVVLKYLQDHRTAPDAVPAAILMASSLTQLGRYADALSLLAPLGSTAAVVAARGTVLLEQGVYREAQAAFDLVLRKPSTLPFTARARVTCERAFVAERTGDAAAASSGYLEALRLYAAAGREQTLFLAYPRVGGTLWDAVAPSPRTVPGPVGNVIAELDRMGEPHVNANYWPESFVTYLVEEQQDVFPRAAPFVDCLVRAARNKEANGEQELAHAIFQTAIAQSSILEGLGEYTYRPALVFIAYVEFLERANFDPRSLEQMSMFALFAAGNINPAYSESDIRNPASPTTSPRMKAFQRLSAVRLRALFQAGDQSDEMRDKAFIVAQDYQSSVAALAVHSHSEGRVHPRDPTIFTKAQHDAFWAQFDRAAPTSTHLTYLKVNPRQLLLMISPGAGTGPGRIWATGVHGTAWAALGSDRETMRTDIETLRCGLDVEMCCRFPPDSRMRAAYQRLLDSFNAEFHLASVGDCRLRDEHFEPLIAYRVFDKIFTDPTIRDMVMKADELIIVPLGEFASIPFGALPIDRPQTGRGPGATASAKWLGIEKAISIYPSINSYVEGYATENDDHLIRLFGVGDPTLGASHGADRTVDCAQFAHRNRRVRGVPSGDPMFALSPLPGTRCELLSISKLEGVASSHASLLLWDRATEGRVRAAAKTNQPLSQADVLVFATHGLIRGDFGLGESALVLSRPRRKGPTHADGFLTLSEIMQLHIRAKLVILSACNTGSSGEAAGDALASFATAFFRAGAEAVLLSQWTVRDDVAAFVTPRLVALMQGESTVTQCQRGDEGPRTKAEALRMALCEVRHSEVLGADLPGDWAPFVLVGGRSKL